MFVTAETLSMPMHVIGVLFLDGSTMPDAALLSDDPRSVIRRLVTERLPLIEPLRWRLVESPGGLGSVLWINDSDFDLDAHLHFATLPAPGGTAELEAYMGAVASHPLERDRPLWEMHLVDGLADGQVAMVTKLHHAFMDGGAGTEVMGALFDLTPDADTPPPVDDFTPEQPPSSFERVIDIGASLARRVWQVPDVLVRTATGMGGLVGAMFPTAGSDGARRSFTAPRTPYNGTLTPDRVVSLTTHPLADLKKIKDHFGVKVNDVVLAAVTAALRADLIAKDAFGALDGRALVAAVPISVRTASKQGEFGNQTSAMMISLPVQIDDPVDRLRAIHDEAVLVKERHQDMGSDLLEDWAALFPPIMSSVGAQLMERLELGRRTPPVFNLIVSNVQGPSMPVYLAGARITGLYPFGPLIHNVGLNITVFSQDDTLFIGLIADPTLVDGPETLTAGTKRGITELKKLTVKPRAATRRRPASETGRGDSTRKTSRRKVTDA